jgi:hypothetical protein
MKFTVTVPDEKSKRLVEAFASVFEWKPKIPSIQVDEETGQPKNVEIDNPVSAEDLMCAKIGDYAVQIGNQLVSRELDAEWDAKFATEKFAADDVVVEVVK